MLILYSCSSSDVNSSNYLLLFPSGWLSYWPFAKKKREQFLHNEIIAHTSTLKSDTNDGKTLKKIAHRIIFKMNQLELGAFTTTNKIRKFISLQFDLIQCYAHQLVSWFWIYNTARAWCFIARLYSIILCVCLCMDFVYIYGCLLCFS